MIDPKATLVDVGFAVPQPRDSLQPIAGHRSDSNLTHGNPHRKIIMIPKTFMQRHKTSVRAAVVGTGSLPWRRASTNKVP